MASTTPLSTTETPQQVTGAPGGDTPPPPATNATTPTSATAKTTKRKRISSTTTTATMSNEEKVQLIKSLREETEGLFRYYREFISKKPLDFSVSTSSPSSNSSSNAGNMMNSHVAMLMEESDLPFTMLVEEIHGKLLVSDAIERKSVSVSAVKSAVLFVGQRVVYGVPNLNADVLEDHNPDSLWCWETRDLKLIPKHVRGLLHIRRVFRKKIHERITAICAMMAALQKSESDQNYARDVGKASEKLHKVLKEADICLLVENMLQKNGAELADREVKREEKLLLRQLEKNKREAEKEKKRMDLELQKEQRQIEKERRRLQEEAEKEEKKQLRKQQEEAGKEHLRQEKEESEMKKRIALQKQASLLERFLKRSKRCSPSQNNQSSTEVTTTASGSSSNGNEPMHEAITIAMDCTLSSIEDIGIDELYKSHLSSWHLLGRAIRSNKKRHWTIRRQLKTVLFGELKLTTSRDSVREDEPGMGKAASGWEEQSSGEKASVTDADFPFLELKKCIRRKQLLQFDKSHRPAFYGIWPKKSHFVGPRCPLKKDPNLDYDVDSDEEWEEEEPGESLSDCDKDDEGMEDEFSKTEDEEESEDGFFVPDGYLSENEGVQVDKMEINLSVGEARTPSSCEKDLETQGFYKLLQKQKYLNNITQNSLKRNQPFIILNLMHDKVPILEAEDAHDAAKVETICLEALSMRTFHGGPLKEISLDDMGVEDEDACLSQGKASISISSMATIQESDIPVFVSTIQSCSQSINKVVESLQQKFPNVSKSQLRNKVREISEYVDNHWKVKKEVLDELDVSISPGKSGRRVQNITTIFSKRCLPPPGNSGCLINLNDNSPKPSLKSSSVFENHK